MKNMRTLNKKYLKGSWNRLFHCWTTCCLSRFYHPRYHGLCDVFNNNIRCNRACVTKTICRVNRWLFVFITYWHTAGDNSNNLGLYVDLRTVLFRVVSLRTEKISTKNSGHTTLPFWCYLWKSVNYSAVTTRVKFHNQYCCRCNPDTFSPFCSGFICRLYSTNDFIYRNWSRHFNFGRASNLDHHRLNDHRCNDSAWTIYQA